MTVPVSACSLNAIKLERSSYLRMDDRAGDLVQHTVVGGKPGRDFKICCILRLLVTLLNCNLNAKKWSFALSFVPLSSLLGGSKGLMCTLGGIDSNVFLWL